MPRDLEIADAVASLRRGLKSIAGAALLALVLTGLPASSATAASCPLHKGYRVVASSSTAVITRSISGYNRGPNDSDQFRRYRGCLRPTGREGLIATGLNIRNAGAYDVVEHNDFTLNGPYVAWASQYGAKGDGAGANVIVRNLATKAPARVAFLREGGTTPAGRKASQLRLRNDGAVAFVSMNATDAQLFGLDRDGLRQFDSSTAGQLTNVWLNGPQLRWTRAGEPREAPFDTAP